MTLFDVQPIFPPSEVYPGHIEVQMFPGDQHPLVLEMASTLGSSTAFAPVESFTRSQLQSGAYRYRMGFNLDGRRRYFRARHNAAGWTAGAYTRTVSAVPKPRESIDASTSGGHEWKINADSPSMAEGVMKEEGVIRTTGQEVGTLSGSTSVTKHIVIGAGSMRPAGAVSSTAYNYNVDGKRVTADSDSATMDMVYSFVIPAGVTVTGINSAQRQTVTTSDTGVGAVVQFGYSTGSTASNNVFVTLQTSTGDAAYQGLDSSAISHTVSSGDVFFLLGRVKYATSTDLSSIGVQTISYTMGAYEDSY